jgi:opacity protein-like surface antigen
MKKKVLLAAVVLLAVSALAQAQDELHGFIDLTYQSKYLWRGIDVYGDKSAIQPTLMLDLYGTGLGFSVEGHRANSSGFENTERWDFTLFYKNALFMDESYAMQYLLGWRYFYHPDAPLDAAPGLSIDLQEIHAVMSFPKILQVEGLVPTYVLVKLWPAESGSFVGSAGPAGTASGYAHIFMLDYALPIEDLLPDMPEQVLNLHSEFVFNDGVDPRGIGVDHDWTNAVFGVSTDFALEEVENVTVTPGLYYQITMDDSINDDQDELWCTLGVKYSF